jgi:branched-chain amino acid transport system permease protein
MGFLQIVTSGLLVGGVYALAALGLSICWGVLNILNIAHGEFLMLGCVAAYGVYAFTGINPFLIVLVIVPIFFGFSYLFEKILIRPMRGKTETETLVASILVTLGAALVIEDVTAFFWGKSFTGIPYSMASLKVGGVVIPLIRLSILIFILALTWMIQVYLKRSYTGKAIQAITQNREGARVVGINIIGISMVTFIIGSVLASIAGVFYVVLYSMTPYMGLALTVKYMCIVVLGGLGSLFGSLAGGVILGVTEAIVGYYFGSDWSPTVAYMALVLILLLRPQGLFGRK